MKGNVYSSEFLILKTDALYLFEKIRKKFKFEETLNKVAKHNTDKLISTQSRT